MRIIILIAIFFYLVSCSVESTDNRKNQTSIFKGTSESKNLNREGLLLSEMNPESSEKFSYLSADLCLEASGSSRGKRSFYYDDDRFVSEKKCQSVKSFVEGDTLTKASSAAAKKNVWLHDIASERGYKFDQSLNLWIHSPTGSRVSNVTLKNVMLHEPCDQIEKLFTFSFRSLSDNNLVRTAEGLLLADVGGKLKRFPFKRGHGQYLVKASESVEISFSVYSFTYSSHEVLSQMPIKAKIGDKAEEHFEIFVDRFSDFTESEFDSLVPYFHNENCIACHGGWTFAKIKEIRGPLIGVLKEIRPHAGGAINRSAAREMFEILR